MKKVVSIGLLSALLAACTGGGGTSSSSVSSISVSSSSIKASSSSINSSAAVSSSSVTVISSSVASSSSSVSSVAVSSSSSSTAALVGNIANGRTLMKNTSGLCFACHEDSNEDGLFEAKLITNDLDVNNFDYPQNTSFASGNYTGLTLADLTRFIEERMPLNPSECTGQCAADIAAYLWSLRGKNVEAGPTSCVSTDPVRYGRRALKFLTTYEYNNSLKALFGKELPYDYSTPAKIGGDISVNGLPNHGHASVNEGRLNSYDSNAKEIAAWAVETTGALPFSCTDANSCAQSFINDFAFYAFRRPLTEEEVDEYTSMITGASKPIIGLQWAIHSALMSPQFLYRSELGKTAGQTVTEIETGPAKVVYVPAKDPIDVTNTSPANAGYQFTGNDLVIATVTTSSGFDYSTNPARTVFPAVKIFGIEGIAPIPTSAAGQFTVTFHVKGITGNVYYMDVGSAGQVVINGTTYNGNVSKVSLKVAPATVKETPVEFTNKVKSADPAAYVLDEFEYASALAFMLTGAAPDKELMDAALTGKTEHPDLMAAQIDRLIDSPLGQKQVERFAGLWFKTDGVVSVNRFGNDKFTQDVKNSMAQEIREMYKHVFYDESVPYKALFTGDFTMIDKTLGDFYGIAGASGSDFVKVSTAGTTRGGLIASGAYMALYAHDDRTSPIKRAVHVRQDMLCQSIPQPGALNDGDARKEAALRAQEKEATGTLTTTEFYDLQTNVPGTSCAVCHNAVINPLFAADDFDNVGLARKVVNGAVVQKGLGASGVADVPIAMVNNGGFLYLGDTLGGVNTQLADEAKAQGNGIAFKGAKQLSKALVDNELPGIDACLVQKTYRFALGAPLTSTDVDARYESALSTEEKGQLICINEELNASLGSANNPKAMLKKLSLSDVVRFRR